MSGNTNTLFWVITGAVVVLGVFLLTQNNGNSSVRDINDKFSSYFDDVDTDPNLKRYYDHVENYKDLHITDESLFDFDPYTQTITGYNGTDVNIVIPYEINGVEVKKIGEWNLYNRHMQYEYCDYVLERYNQDPDDFENQMEYEMMSDYGSIVDGVCVDGAVLESIVFPNTVTEINDNAFLSNEGLTEVYLSPNIEKIGSQAFQSCNIQSLDLSKLTKLNYIGAYAFSDNDIHGTLIIPNSVTNMDYCAFEYNEIEYAIISKNLSFLPLFSFRNNPSMEYVIFLSDDMTLRDKVNGYEYTFTQDSDFIVYVPTGSLSHYSGLQALEDYNIVEKDYPEYE